MAHDYEVASFDSDPVLPSSGSCNGYIVTFETIAPSSSIVDETFVFRKVVMILLAGFTRSCCVFATIQPILSDIFAHAVNLGSDCANISASIPCGALSAVYDWPGVTPCP